MIHVLVSSNYPVLTEPLWSEGELWLSIYRKYKSFEQDVHFRSKFYDLDMEEYWQFKLFKFYSLWNLGQKMVNNSARSSDSFRKGSD